MDLNHAIIRLPVRQWVSENKQCAVRVLTNAPQDICPRESATPTRNKHPRVGCFLKHPDDFKHCLVRVVVVCWDIWFLDGVCVTDCGDKIIQVYITVINTGINLIDIIVAGCVMKFVVYDKCAGCMIFAVWIHGVYIEIKSVWNLVKISNGNAPRIRTQGWYCCFIVWYGGGKWNKTVIVQIVFRMNIKRPIKSR